MHGGQVIGTTDRRGADPVTRRVHARPTSPRPSTRRSGIDLATVLHDREGREIPMLPTGQPIKGVL